MRRMGTVDLEILNLAVGRGGTFDERDIEGSGLRRLGVGRTLDALASLKDRKMIRLDEGGSFTITEMAREILWSDSVPLWARILRLLQVRSCSSDEIACILGVSEDDAVTELGQLRKDRLVLMAPQKIGGAVTRVFEILPEGETEIERTESEGFERRGAAPQRAEILELVEGIRKDVQDSDVQQAAKDAIAEKIARLRDALRV